MLQMTSNTLSAEAQLHLTDVQNAINAMGTFDEKVTAAKNAWKNQTNNAAFNEIKRTLMGMCVHNTICNYCEATEGTDIEHILPKSFFPEFAFVWENYLLACKTCNSAYKLDKISVFDPPPVHKLSAVARGTEPTTPNTAMINIRLIDPSTLIDLDLKNGTFFEKFPINTVEYEKARYTIDEALFLNIRDNLREARESTFKEQFRNLSYAVLVHESSSFDELDQHINTHEPFITIDRTKNFNDLKIELLDYIKNAILTKRHPTVWAEMKLQYIAYPRLEDLFNRFRAALTW